LNKEIEACTTATCDLTEKNAAKATKEAALAELTTEYDTINEAFKYVNEELRIKEEEA
jgi:hypothetical protein